MAELNEVYNAMLKGYHGFDEGVDPDSACPYEDGAPEWFGYMLGWLFREDQWLEGK